MSDLAILKHCLTVANVRRFILIACKRLNGGVRPGISLGKCTIAVILVEMITMKIKECTGCKLIYYKESVITLGGKIAAAGFREVLLII